MLVCDSIRARREARINGASGVQQSRSTVAPIFLLITRLASDSIISVSRSNVSSFSMLHPFVDDTGGAAELPSFAWGSKVFESESGAVCRLLAKVLKG